MTRLLPLLPAALLALFAGGLGTLEGAARAPHAAIGAALLLLVALLARRDLADPWRLGRGGWVAPAALLLLAGTSLWASPLPRAGITAVALLPAFFLLPAAVVRAFATAQALRVGLAAWSLVVAAISVHALLAAARDRTPAAQPLGEPELLGALLAIALPPALAGLAMRGATVRAASAAAALAGGAALLATRALVALVALGVAALVAASRPSRARLLLLGIAFVALGAAAPGLDRVVRGETSTARACAGVAKSALAGARARPGIGWGPGSFPWTIGDLLRPEPGLDDEGRVVGEPCAVPLRVAYELGFPALLLLGGAAGLWARARRHELRGAFDRRAGPAQLAGSCGAAAGGVAALGGSWLAIPALPVAFALAMGLAQSAAAPRAAWPRRRTGAARAALALLLLACGVTLAPLELARADYERASRTDSPEARAAGLAAAQRRDPAFPLYGARLAWHQAGREGESVAQALAAAQAARGVAPLWLRAGVLALESGQLPQARAALARALALDPLAAPAPYLLFAASRGRSLDCAARAVLAEPRLAAALVWRGDERRRQAALARVRAWPGIDPRWRRQLAEQTRQPPRGREARDLVHRMDVDERSSVSLHLFRRSPWRAELARLRVDRVAAQRVRLAPATRTPGMPRTAFPAERCAPEVPNSKK
jgi:tetratricopeptide (TPR) repeat protein